MRLVNRPLTEDLRARLRKIPKQHSPFEATWSKTLELLDRECRQLLRPGVDEVVLMVDVGESMLRLDGGIKANARPYSDDVALAIDSKQGPLIFPSGNFWDWKSNVRAIALGMEALRRVDRYGISPAGEQYTGWQAIGSGVPMPAVKMTVDEAERFLLAAAGGQGDSASWQDVYRRAAKALHPDRPGGDAELFRKATEALSLLVGAS